METIGDPAPDVLTPRERDRQDIIFGSVVVHARRLAEDSARVLARASATARLVALSEVAVLGEPLFDQIVHAGVE